jgi:formate--tetrahydrofolate ligase
VTTARAIKHHGGVDHDDASDAEAARALEEGMANVRRHLGIVGRFGVPCVVAVNRRPGDTDDEIETVKRLAVEAGAHGAEVNEGFTEGGTGVAALAEVLVDACEAPSDFRLLYPDDASITEKIEAIATQVYGARDVEYSPAVQEKIRQFTDQGLDRFPICMAKTHLSLSADPRLRNAPEDFTLPVRDIRAYTGAGWLVPLTGDIMQMPGLGQTPAALDVDIDDNGRTVGLF